jgi:putative membrane protein
VWLALLPSLLVLAPYGFGVLRLAGRGIAWPRVRTVWAGIATVALTVALAPSLSGTDDFRAHVAQHLLLAMLAPLALASASPLTLALRTVAPHPRHRLSRLHRHALVRCVLRAPVVLALEVGGLYAYYLTPLFGFAERHAWAHAVVHAHMFLAGYLFSWCVVARDPLPARTGTRSRLLALVAAAGAHEVLTKLMYAHGLPHADVTHLRDGARLMYAGGDVVEVLLAVSLMAQWYARTGRSRELRRLAERPAS